MVRPGLTPGAGKLARRMLALVALLFGAATLFAGSRVLLGADPGYVVYRPLLVFNTAMGITYLAAGALAWRSSRRGAQAAAVVFLLNAAVLAFITWLAQSADAVAVQSLQAMGLRTAVWLLLLLGLAWLARGKAR